MLLLLLMLLPWQGPDAVEKETEPATRPMPSSSDSRGRAHRNAPVAHDFARKPGVNAYETLVAMFDGIEKYWFVDGYERAGSLRSDARLTATLPPPRVAQRVNGAGTFSFDVDVEGLFTPGGEYRLDLEGDLGEVELVKNRVRRYMASADFQMYSDSPNRARSRGANLRNYLSFFRRHMGALRAQMLDSGQYRYVYGGTGNFEGRLVHQVRVYKPAARDLANQTKGPVPMSHFWNFWKEGGYELWIYADTNLPATLVYSNTEDNIYANLTFRYNREHLPTSVVINNNSIGAEGTGELRLTYDGNRMVDGLDLRFDSDGGISLELSASLLFGARLEKDAFRVLPTFGYKKVNRDVLKLMVMTKISGGLLRLKQYGVNIKNFNFRD